ncbi:hypothetical protein TL16_g10374 [Triparma laevis f. inornata]|uniref:Uncharacterized protein n=1 Tax=Triparma laevis f. inornata TaxID=1714386 RepID=A0A9W7EM77_9STRA|nr:hypothetical protein TL16_g10374 [Triparma laevis f. inornata]
MGNNKSSCNNAKALRVTHEDQISNEPPNPSAPSALVETSFDLSPDVSDDDGYVLEEDEIMLNLSSSESESDSDSEEENDDDVFAQFRQDRAEALAAVREMKEVVAWFHHPSAPIKVTAPPARCFFERASVALTCLNETDATAPKGVIYVEGAEEQEERRETLAAAAKMRETVSWYTNPSQVSDKKSDEKSDEKNDIMHLYFILTQARFARLPAPQGVPLRHRQCRVNRPHVPQRGRLHRPQGHRRRRGRGRAGRAPPNPRHRGRDEEDRELVPPPV